MLTQAPGDKVQVELKRGGDAKTVTVKLGNRPNQPVAMTQPRAEAAYSLMA